MNAPDRPWRHQLSALLRLAWPVVLSRATQAVIGFCDVLFVAPLGEASLAATATGALNTIAFLILPMGTLFIIQSFTAQLRGRGELASVPRFAWYGLSLAGIAALLSAAASPFIPRYVALFGYAPAVEHAMATYVSIRLFSVGGALGMEALGNWFGGLGNTRVGMIGSVVAMTANVAGAWLFIQPRLGMPGWGVTGAAWTTVGASWLGFAVVFALFLRSKERGVAPVKLHFAELRRVLRFGLPNGVNWFLEFAAFIMFINVVIGHLGTTVLAAFNVVMEINSMGFMPAFGLSSAGAILVGEAIGRRKHDEVWPIVRLTAIVAASWMLALAVVYVAIPNRLLGLFSPHDRPAGELVTVGSHMLALAAIWQLFDAIAMTVSEALRAAGDTAWCMGARIVLAWVVFTPVAWTAVLYLGGGVNTVMASLIGYLALLAITFAVRFARGRWKSIDLVGAEPTL